MILRVPLHRLYVLSVIFPNYVVQTVDWLDRPLVVLSNGIVLLTVLRKMSYLVCLRFLRSIITLGHGLDAIVDEAYCTGQVG